MHRVTQKKKDNVESIRSESGFYSLEKMLRNYSVSPTYWLSMRDLPLEIAVNYACQLIATFGQF